jgi:hypothetical protein
MAVWERADYLLDCDAFGYCGLVSCGAFSTWVWGTISLLEPAPARPSQNVLKPESANATPDKALVCGLGFVDSSQSMVSTCTWEYVYPITRVGPRTTSSDPRN